MSPEWAESEIPTAKRLFVADDNADFRSMVSKVARHCRWTVTEASDGRELVQALSSCDDDGVILLDVRMPDMDGFEAIAELADKGERRPIYILTGGAKVFGTAAEAISKSKELNTVRMLQKPISVANIIAILSCQR